MDKSTQDELLDVVADYADLMIAAADAEQTASMRTAFALDTLYEQGDWVDEWLEQSPEPKNPRSFQADSRNRFTKWVEWREVQRGRRCPHGRYQYRLLAAAENARNLSLANWPNLKLTESQLRPLTWLRKQGRSDRIPEVWQRAVESAGSQELITAEIVTDALQEFKTEVLGAAAKGLKPIKVDQRARRVIHWRIKRKQLTDEIILYGRSTIFDPEGRVEWRTFAGDLHEILTQSETKMLEISGREES